MVCRCEYKHDPFKGNIMEQLGLREVKGPFNGVIGRLGMNRTKA